MRNITFTDEIKDKLYNEMFSTADTFKYFNILQTDKTDIIRIPYLFEEPYVCLDAKVIVLDNRGIIFQDRYNYYNNLDNCGLTNILKHFGGDVDKLLYQKLFDEFDKDNIINSENKPIKNAINVIALKYIFNFLYEEGSEIFIPKDYFNTIDKILNDDIYLKQLTVNNKGKLFYKDVAVHFCYFNDRCFSTPKDNIFIGLNIDNDIKVIDMDCMNLSKMRRSEFYIRSNYHIGINYLNGSLIKLLNII